MEKTYGTRLAFERPQSETFNIIGQSGTRLTATVNESGYDLSLYSPHGGEEHSKRFIGCMILLMLPLAGVDEALDRLSSYWEFYAQPLALSAPSEPVREYTGIVVHGDPAHDVSQAE